MPDEQFDEDVVHVVPGRRQRGCTYSGFGDTSVVTGRRRRVKEYFQGLASVDGGGDSASADEGVEGLEQPAAAKLNHAADVLELGAGSPFGDDRACLLQEGQGATGLACVPGGGRRCHQPYAFRPMVDAQTCSPLEGDSRAACPLRRLARSAAAASSSAT